MKQAVNIALLAISIAAIQVSGKRCYHVPLSAYMRTQTPGSCDPGHIQIYAEQDKETKTYDVLCCAPGTDEAYFLAQNDACRKSDKPYPNSVPASKDLCKDGLSKRRFVNNKEINYVEVARDQYDADNVQGLCCPKGKLDELFTTLDMAERHEFPHFVKLGNYGCGGTVYNENWIITAAHCISQHDSIPKRLRDKSVDTEHDWNDCCAQVRINILISNAWTEATYNVVEIVAHPNTSYLDNSVIDPTISFNDIALLRVDRPIKFGENVKALKIAEPGFDPLKYGDSALIMGFGVMDTDQQSQKLQKANVIIHKHEDVHGLDETYKDQLLYVGGIMKGNISSGVGTGDSGGPAVCRDENGMAILCGVTSFVANIPSGCFAGLNPSTCPPSSYTAVEYFNSWIKSVAGEQKQDQLLQQPLYGKTVKSSAYPAHVHLVPSEGESCGGTLVDENIVITAASCILKDPTTPKNSVKVIMGIDDISQDGGTTADVVGVSVMPDFKLGTRKVTNNRRKKRVVSIVKEAWENGKLKDSDIMSEPFYENNIALVKISKSGKTWAKLPTRSPVNGEMAKEVAYRTRSLGTEANGAKPLTERQFKLLDQQECQRRIDRLESIGYNYKTDHDGVCGVELYTGGNKCDRELGGGLYCKGDNGEDVLCGVQTSRWCQFVVPNEFKEVYKLNTWWLQSAIEALKEH